MTNSLLQIGSLWVWILLGLVLIIGLVLLVISAVVKRSAEPKPAAAGGAAPPGEPAPPEPAAEPAGAAGAVESPGASFARAMRFLRSSVAGRDYRYQIPWYLVIGDPESGKSTLMTAAGVNLAPEESRRGVRKSLSWRFLDRGILIGVSGRYFKGGSWREEYDWSRLLRRLQNHRPRRPLDGLVLAVAATDLIGPSALDETQLSARAARFSEMLAQAQRTLGFTFPVYVVVTKCDQIEGYQTFCRELPARSSDDIFGWSSPYHLEASFTADWVDEAFDGMAEDLQRLQSEIFVERSDLKAPDEVFLFPEEFARLRTPLRIYLERLCRETAYREGFRFRGVYFSGDIAEVAPPERQAPPREEDADEEEWLPRIAPARAPQNTAAPRMAVAYVRNLFEQKIFPESGLARPLSRVFLAKSRTVMAIQAVAAMLALILGLGMWLSYRRLAGDRDKLLPVLRMMTKAPDGRSLLLALAPASSVSLRSVFLPASFFSTADEDVTRVMTYACNRWILSSFHDGLMQRKQVLLYPKPVKPAPAPVKRAAKESDQEEEQDTAPPVLNIEATAEYQELERFVNDLKSFRENVGIYENLRQRGQMEDLDRMRKLLGYLGLSDVQPAGHLAQAFQWSSGPPVEISLEDRNAASETMRRLLGKLFQTWFDNNPLLSDVDQLRQGIADLEQGRTGTYADLKNLLDELNQVDNDFSSPTFHWASSPSLDLTGPLARVIENPIDAGNRAVADYARQIGDGYLTKLRKDLFQERTTMTDELLARDPIALSPGSRQLLLALQNAMSLRFMTNGVREPRIIRTTLNENTRLMWRLEPLQEALRLDDIYTQFVNDGLRGAPRQLSLVLRRVAADQLQRNEQDLISQAQEFPARSAARNGANAEDETLAEVNSFRDASEPLLQLANRLQALGATDIRKSVMSVMVLQSYNLLSALDRRLRNDDPYAAKPGNWRGKGSLAQAAYEVRNAAALGDYLTAQRNRIKFLEQQAEPLVPFLNTWLPVRDNAQSRLIAKWQQIIGDFQQYDAKRPGASLTALEDFILTGMDKIVPESACGGGENAAGGIDQTPDYFVGIRNGLLSDVTERCREVSAESVCQSYAGIAALFNKTLAGHFPFAALTPGKAQTEATPEAVLEFYQLLERNGKTARSTLSEDSRFGEAARQALHFLDQMDQLRPLVVPASPDAAKEPPFTLDFIPRFRVNQSNESGGNQIIDWTMQVGGQIFRQREPEHPGRWRAGNPVRLSMRWANDSTFVPASDGQPNLRIRDRNAYFEWTTRWALIAFLRQMETPPSEIEKSGDIQPYTLKFHVKTARDVKWEAGDSVPASGSATVFMHLSVFSPGAKNAILVPAFPTSAPSLGPSCGKE
jgi:type VI secretion system protein ImpL